MGIIAAAADHLRRNEISFAPAASASVTSAWTLRDALLLGAGCNRSAGPLAYWEWTDIRRALAEARARLVPHAGAPEGMGPERWANQPGRSSDEVLAVLDAAVADGDVDPPRQVTIRPWCDPSVVTRCRIPYIPLAATMHAWTMEGGSFGELLDRYEITPTMNSWTLLEVLEPRIAHSEPDAPVAEAAWALRSWMADESGPPVTLASEWLSRLSHYHGDVSYDEMLVLAREHTVEEE